MSGSSFIQSVGIMEEGVVKLRVVSSVIVVTLWRDLSLGVLTSSLGG